MQIDKPAPGDYDGDGVTDLAGVLINPNSGAPLTWRIKQSLSGVTQDIQFGLSGDKIVPGDYDGDGKTDIAVAHRNTGTNQLVWQILRSSDGVTQTVTFGLANDTPLPQPILPLLIEYGS